MGTSNDGDGGLYDAEFRTLMEREVGWPDGRPPAGLSAMPGPWYRLAFLPPRAPDNDRGRAWCEWLLRQGWAVLHDPAHPSDGVWMALPAPYAGDLHRATLPLVRASSVRRWPTGTPSPALLRDCYGGSGRE